MEDKQMPRVRTGRIQNIVGIARNSIAYCSEIRREYGEIVNVPLWRKDVYIISEPELIRRAFVGTEKEFVKPERIYARLRMMIGNGLVTSRGAFWRQQRRMSNPAFKPGSVRGFGKIFQEETRLLLDGWEKGGGENEVRVSSEMMSVTLRIIVRTMFSTGLDADYKALEASMLVLNHMGTYVLRAPVKIPMWIPLPRNLRFKRHMKQMRGVIQGIITERREHGGPAEPDLLSQYMDACDEETGRGMTDKQLMDEMLTIFLAGHETTSSLLTFAFHLLATHPEVQQRMRAEIKETLGEREPEVDDLMNMPYSRMVLEESMRLYPSAHIIMRSPVEDYKYEAYTIPAGSLMFLSLWASFRNPRIWENPDEFDPERFSPERLTEEQKNAFVPFAAGPRMCIGSHFARMEAQYVLVMALQRFELENPRGYEIEPLALVTLTTGTPVPLGVKSLRAAGRKREAAARG